MEDCIPGYIGDAAQRCHMGSTGVRLVVWNGILVCSSLNLQQLQETKIQKTKQNKTNPKPLNVIYWDLILSIRKWGLFFFFFKRTSSTWFSCYKLVILLPRDYIPRRLFSHDFHCGFLWWCFMTCGIIFLGKNVSSYWKIKTVLLLQKTQTQQQKLKWWVCMVAQKTLADPLTSWILLRMVSSAPPPSLALLCQGAVLHPTAARCFRTCVSSAWNVRSLIPYLAHTFTSSRSLLRSSD